jgi:hypothetical protein
MWTYTVQRALSLVLIAFEAAGFSTAAALPGSMEYSQRKIKRNRARSCLLFRCITYAFML